jgi:hypothetical protein
MRARPTCPQKQYILICTLRTQNHVWRADVSIPALFFRALPPHPLRWRVLAIDSHRCILFGGLGQASRRIVPCVLSSGAGAIISFASPATSAAQIILSRERTDGATASLFYALTVTPLAVWATLSCEVCECMCLCVCLCVCFCVC